MAGKSLLGLGSTVVHRPSGGVPARAAVVFSHGLGDTPHGWAMMTSSMSRALPGVVFVHPQAPTRAVTCNGGMAMPSWMDLAEIPVTPTMADSGRDMEDSVGMIHATVDELVQKEGIPADRVLLAGFSQGGALSLVSFLKYPSKLGGCMVLSGWAAPASNVPSLAAASASKESPVFVGHGDSDGVVIPACGDQVVAILKENNYSVKSESYANMAHSSCGREEQDMLDFFKTTLA